MSRILRCSKCQVDQPVSEFSPRPLRARGYNSQCKACVRAFSAAYRRRLGMRRQEDIPRLSEEERRERRAQYQKQYLEDHREERNAYHRAYSQRAERRAFEKARRQTPHYLAYAAVARNLRSGRLERPGGCIACGEICKPRAYLDDFAKPLDPIWLCASCHDSLPKPS